MRPPGSCSCSSDCRCCSSPFAGQIADRGSRRRLVILANLAGAAVVLTLGFVDGKGDVWIIYVVTFLYGMITYLTSAAGSGLVRDLLADDQLAQRQRAAVDASTRACVWSARWSASAPTPRSVASRSRG